ncbi:MAG: hypothetical protein Q8Q31_05390 [Nanoarchaeota archaeon]|nr:hypothetical protein [Nanoarchaeota archaeon]
MKHIIHKGNISKLRGGDSEETFLVRYCGKKFVLRIYEDRKTADYYVKVHKKLSKHGFLPALYYQEKNKILVEYIEGRNCKKSDALKVAAQIGKICALINQLRIKENRQKEKEISHLLHRIESNGLITDKESDYLENKYNLLKIKVKPKLAIDFDDVYPENFRLRRGKVYLVDLEGFETKIMGSGIGKAFLRWFKTSKQRRKFRRGYASIASARFLTKEYLQFLYLNFTISIIAYKVKRNQKINPRDRDRLFQFIDSQVI